MKVKTALQGFIAGVALLIAAGGAGAQERQLFIYNWSDYIDMSVVEDFEKETGIKVTYDLFDSYETMDARVQVGSSGYDIIFPRPPVRAASRGARPLSTRSTSRS